MPSGAAGPPLKGANRAEAYGRYVDAALRDRRWIGTHWFQWADQPATARIHDKENVQCGFVDVTDRPYAGLVAAARAAGARLYQPRPPTGRP